MNGYDLWRVAAILNDLDPLVEIEDITPMEVLDALDAAELTAQRVLSIGDAQTVERLCDRVRDRVRKDLDHRPAVDRLSEFVWDLYLDEIEADRRPRPNPTEADR